MEEGPSKDGGTQRDRDPVSVCTALIDLKSGPRPCSGNWISLLCLQVPIEVRDATRERIQSLETERGQLEGALAGLRAMKE